MWIYCVVLVAPRMTLENGYYSWNMLDMTLKASYVTMHRGIQHANNLLIWDIHRFWIIVKVFSTIDCDRSSTCMTIGLVTKEVYPIFI